MLCNCKACLSGQVAVQHVHQRRSQDEAYKVGHLRGGGGQKCGKQLSVMSRQAGYGPAGSMHSPEGGETH